MTVAPSAGHAHGSQRGHERLTVAAAAVAVLAVLMVPPVAAWLVDLVAPVDRFPMFELTDRAQRAAELPGANVLGDSVIVFVTPEMHVPALRASQRVLPSESAGMLVPLGVSGLLPMNPYLGPAGAEAVTSGLWPGDRVFSDLGPLVVGCLPTADDPPGDCTATLLIQHATGYYRYPRSLGSNEFLDRGTPMEAQIYDVLGGQVVIGGLPGTAADRVVVTMDDGTSLTAFTTTSPSPGDVVWWAVTTDPDAAPAEATAYDRGGNRLGTVDLNGQL